MNRHLIPKNIRDIFLSNPKISRDTLASMTGISNQKARFYCTLNKEMRYKASKVVKRGVVLFDIHYPVHNEACMSIVKKFIKDFEPHHLIIGGDALDLACISDFNKAKPKLIEKTRLSKEYKGFQKEILTPLENAIPDKCKKYYLIGNHEWRVDRLVEGNPQLEGLVELETNLNLEDYTIIPFNGTLNLGEMSFIHGITCNKYHSEKNVSTYNTNIFSGHLHTSQVYTKVSPLNSLPKSGVSVGCLCDMNPHYMQNKPNAWVHQFLYFYMFEDGSFTYYTPTIINGKVMINNKLYVGDTSA